MTITNFFIFSCLSLILIQTSIYAQDQEHLKYYKNVSYGLSFFYPENWNVIDKGIDDT